MAGIMVAVAGNAQNIQYVSGLWVVEQNTTQQSPITSSTSTTGFVSIARNWVGYFLSPSTGSVGLSIQVSAFQGDFAETVGRLWLGNNAIAGNNAQASITISRNFGTGTSTANFNLTAGVYYPIRIRWNGTYDGSSGFFFDEPAGGSITFLASGSSNVTGRIFYNSLTNGF
jgi:hypothetical protein